MTVAALLAGICVILAGIACAVIGRWWTLARQRTGAWVLDTEGNLANLAHAQTVVVLDRAGETEIIASWASTPGVDMQTKVLLARTSDRGVASAALRTLAEHLAAIPIIET